MKWRRLAWWDLASDTVGRWHQGGVEKAEGGAETEIVFTVGGEGRMIGMEVAAPLGRRSMGLASRERGMILSEDSEQLGRTQVEKYI
jgi:hypothetical protein